MRDNALRTDNQQGSFWTNTRNPSETTRRAPLTTAIAKAYLFGALHDGYRRTDGRIRFGQRDIRWLYVLRAILRDIGYRSWIYREGKERHFHILESVAPILRETFQPESVRMMEEKQAYIRGFFDAEGGVPRSTKDQRYVQLVQKDRQKIFLIKQWLEECGISIGKPHNPSKRVDPNYWRIFVRNQSIQRFAEVIGSWHPRKRAVFQEWMKI